MISSYSFERLMLSLSVCTSVTKVFTEAGIIKNHGTVSLYCA